MTTKLLHLLNLESMEQADDTEEEVVPEGEVPADDDGDDADAVTGGAVMDEEVLPGEGGDADDEGGDGDDDTEFDA